MLDLLEDGWIFVVLEFGICSFSWMFGGKFGWMFVGLFVFLLGVLQKQCRHCRIFQNMCYNNSF